MTEAFVETETDRTKSRWVAKAYHDFVQEFGRPRTTQRALFYYALQRKASDYPICGGFVGEIRITRPYHECDGEKLPKWTGRAKRMGLIPEDAILEDTGKEQIFLPAGVGGPVHREVWLNKSELVPLLQPVCEDWGTPLVAVAGKASDEMLSALGRRCSSPAQVLCLSDLSPEGLSFVRDTEKRIAEMERGGGCTDISVTWLALRADQVQGLGLPMVRARPGSKEDREEFKRYLKPWGLDSKKAVELDSLEVYCAGGIAGFLNEALSSRTEVL